MNNFTPFSSAFQAKRAQATFSPSLPGSDIIRDVMRVARVIGSVVGLASAPKSPKDIKIEED